MVMELKELNDKKVILSTYDIYKQCMYMPSIEKFNKKVDTFLNDSSIKIFACLFQNEIKSIIVISFFERNKIEIIGIAVEESIRGKGIGTYMVKSIVNKYKPVLVVAETDDDAVGFYRKNRFTITGFEENFGGEKVVRYKCEL